MLNVVLQYKIHFQVPTNYDFVYSVHDSYSGDEHSHSERKTDSMTEGQYSVRLPDGRTQVGTELLWTQFYNEGDLQVVSYTADDGGYHPIVEYQGEARTDHPQHYHHPHHPLPSIHFAPEKLDRSLVNQ